ncbi:MAG: M20/M25/M40 family metallo-hydrolase [Spirochaetes bacterium]|nr:M20/M25/M40 family metallo-hydrolase [Spirochaetota bacterium]MBN2771988.1 M20/M25/M40 family metallo-hydrolase [Spirochaetota bacterium]
MYQVNEKRLYKIFKDLASISSPSMKEEKVIDYLEEFSQKHGLSFTAYPCGKSRNVMMKLKATDVSKKSVLFSAHTDTVTPCENIKVIENETRFTSDGTTVLGGDDKAGIAAVLEAVLYISENKIPHGDLELLFTCAEEIGLVGMKAMNLKNIKSKLCYVLDSGGPIGTAAIQAPYHLFVGTEIKGKAAHAGMEPENGISAITALAGIISKLPSGRIDAETTTNIGTVSGGKATNIVAADASFALEIRSLSQKKMKALESKIIQTIKNEALKHRVKVKIERNLEYSGFCVKMDSPVIEHFEKACASIKIKPRYEASGGGSDTNVLQSAGLEAVNLSAGMSKVHTTSEYIKKSDLVKLSRLVTALIDKA